jgi:hypothetical protein
MPCIVVLGRTGNSASRDVIVGREYFELWSQVLQAVVIGATKEGRRSCLALLQNYIVATGAARLQPPPTFAHLRPLPVLLVLGDE